MKLNLRFVVAAVLSAGLQISFAADADLSKLAAADNTFCFKLLKELVTEQPKGNIFISPYSAATALQMAANGAAGQTKIEMQQVLETSGISATALNAASKAAADLLNPKDTNVILTTANALWYRRSAQIKPGFVEANQKFFSSTVKALDFGDARAAEAEINQWASDQTHGRINGIANEMIDSVDTDLVLANAIYFKGKWEDPFDAKLTKERPFHPASGATKDLPMMEKSKQFAYHKAYGYQAVRLPYQGDNLAMYVFLTDTNYSPAILVQNLNSDLWRRVTLSGFDGNDGHLMLPKFKLENKLDPIPPLQKLGMNLAFDPERANFSGMFQDMHFISKMRQKTFLAVDEEGTEAAAVHSSSWTHGFHPPLFEMIVDRPFLFAIVDVRSEMILFLGVVNDL